MVGFAIGNIFLKAHDIVKPFWLSRISCMRKLGIVYVRLCGGMVTFETCTQY